MIRDDCCRVVMLALLAASGCGTSDSGDGSVDGDTAALCDAGNPGVRVHVQVDFVSDEETPLWSGGRDALGLSTNGGGLSTTADLYASQLDSEHQAVLVMRYPDGTVAGPATVGFYGIHGTDVNWEGRSDLAADPEGCEDVELAVAVTPPG